MTLRPTRALPSIAAALALVAGLAGCSGGAADSVSGAVTAPPTAAVAETSAPAEASWPRSIELAGRTVEIPAAPQRIVAVTSETADLALQLAGPERLAAVAASSQSPASGTVVELASQVAQTLPPGTDPDPEQILSFGPDLIITTSRHGGEEQAAALLETTGVPVLAFPSSAFASPEELASAIRTLGEALGADASAEQLSGDLETRIAEVDALRLGAAPSTLALMSRGQSVMPLQGTMLANLIARAGGVDAGASLGLASGRPIDAELIAAANPEILFLEDFQGKGRQPFEALLANPALASVPAIANNRIVLVPTTQASAISGANTPDGYRAIVEAVNGAK